MAKATDIYPLPEEEKQELVKATLLSEGILVVGGIVGAIILAGLTTGDWLGSLLLGWLGDFASKFTLSWAMIILPVLMVGIVLVIDKFGLKYSASYQKAKLELAQGLNGELPRMDNGQIVLCMSLAGICEEFLFRYALLGILLFLVALVLPGTAGVVVAVVISAVLFWVIHAQYRDPWSISLALSGGLILGFGYVISGSLLSCMVAHAVYNTVVLLVERRAMVSDPNYFGGKVPNTYILDLNAEAEAKKAAKAADDSCDAKLETDKDS